MARGRHYSRRNWWNRGFWGPRYYPTPVYAVTVQPSSNDTQKEPVDVATTEDDSKAEGILQWIEKNWMMLLVIAVVTALIITVLRK